MRKLLALPLLLLASFSQAQDFRIPYALGSEMTPRGEQILSEIESHPDFQRLQELGGVASTRQTFLDMLIDQGGGTYLEFYSYDRSNKLQFMGNELSNQSGKYRATYCTTRLRQIRGNGWRAWIGIALKATGDIRVKKANITLANLFSFNANATEVKAEGELFVDPKGIGGDGLMGLSFPETFSTDSTTLTKMLVNFARFDERLWNKERQFAFRPQLLYTDVNSAKELNIHFDKDKFLKNRK